MFSSLDTFSIKLLLFTWSIADTVVSVRRMDVTDVTPDPTEKLSEQAGDVQRYYVLYSIPEEVEFDSYVSFRASSIMDCKVTLEPPFTGRPSEGIEIKSENKQVIVR